MIDRAMDFFMDKVCPILFMLAIAGIVIAIPLGGYAWYVSEHSPTFELRKNEWACTSSHTEQSTVYVKTGNVMLPVTSHDTVCDQWSIKR